MNLDKIEKIDRQDKILKKTPVMLMPVIAKYNCKNKDDLIKALKKEKKYSPFVNSIKRQYQEARYFREPDWLLFSNFMNELWMLIERDFITVGRAAEEAVANELVKRGFTIKERTQDELIEDESKGIDLRVLKGVSEYCISVKSEGFWNSADGFIDLQLYKMVENVHVLFIVNKTTKRIRAFPHPVIMEIQQVRRNNNALWKVLTMRNEYE